MMNPVVLAAVVVLLVLFTGALAAMSLVGFLNDVDLGVEVRREGGGAGRGRPG